MRGLYIAGGLALIVFGGLCAIGFGLSQIIMCESGPCDHKIEPALLLAGAFAGLILGAYLLIASGPRR